MGECKFGPSITRFFDFGRGYSLRTIVGTSGIFNFGIRNANTSTSNALGNNQLRARLDTGIEVANEYGIRFTAAGYYDGVGVNDYDAYGGKLGLIILLN